MDGYALLLGFGKYLAFCCKKLGQRSDIADIERFWAKGVKSHAVFKVAISTSEQMTSGMWRTQSVSRDRPLQKPKNNDSETKTP